jgi:hypothetical protein
MSESDRRSGIGYHQRYFHRTYIVTFSPLLNATVHRSGKALHFSDCCQRDLNRGLQTEQLHQMVVEMPELQKTSESDWRSGIGYHQRHFQRTYIATGFRMY